MKITELASKHQINDPFVIAFMSELKTEYGEDSKIFKKAKQICNEFYRYDDSEYALASIKQKLQKLSSEIAILAILKSKQ